MGAALADEDEGRRRVLPLEPAQGPHLVGCDTLANEVRREWTHGTGASASLFGVTSTNYQQLRHACGAASRAIFQISLLMGWRDQMQQPGLFDVRGQLRDVAHVLPVPLGDYDLGNCNFRRANGLIEKSLRQFIF
jgi:hypothetical protein